MTTGFYCTVKRGEKTAWLLGPFAEHEKAKEWAFAASCKASDIDPRVAFDPYGTAAITREGVEIAELPKGKLNHLFPKLFN